MYYYRFSWVVGLVFTLLISLRYSSFTAIILLFFFALIGLIHTVEFKDVGWQSNFSKYYKKGIICRFEVLEISHGKLKWRKAIAEVKDFQFKGRVVRCRKKILFIVEDARNQLKEGDVLLCNSDLLLIRNKGNPGEFDGVRYWKSKGIMYMVFVPKGEFRKIGNNISGVSRRILQLRSYFLAILSHNLKGEELGLAQALILGDRSLLDSEVKTAFSNSGAMHVLAVSGLHIGIILQLLMHILKRFSRVITKLQSLIIAVVILWIYAIITGLSVSVVRAVFMFSVLAYSQVKGKRYSNENSLFFSAFVLLLINPNFLFDIGYELSFLAMLGIFWFYRNIATLIYLSNKWFRKVWEGTALGIAAQMMTFPLTLYYFHQFPNYFLLTNLIIMLVTGLILGLGMVVFAIHWFKGFTVVVFYVLGFLLFLLLRTVYGVEKLPGSTAEGFLLHEYQLIVIYLVLVLFHFISIWRWLLLFLLSLFILLSLIVFQRFRQMDHSEICFFNHSEAAFVIKDKYEAYCFYMGKAEKTHFIFKSFLKLHPARAHYYCLTGKDWFLKIGRRSINVRNRSDGVELEFQQKRYFLVFKRGVRSNQAWGTRILMPWLLKVNNQELSLKNNAVRFMLDANNFR